MLLKEFIVIIIFSILSCNTNNDFEKEKERPIVTSDLSGIDVKEGMSLVGKITEDKTGEPIQKVVVSDGFTATTTDKNGIYQLARNKDSKFVFYSIPSKFEINIKEGTPIFFDEIPSYYDIYRKDFVLKKLEKETDNSFTLICMADPQVKNSSDIIRFEKETLQDIKQNFNDHENIYAITLGDVVHDKPEFLEQMKNLMNNTGITFFQTIGNHDHNEEASNDSEAILNFENIFGPVNYSFNRGDAHIVVMDNVLYSGKQNYSTGFTSSQINWLKENLEYVSKDKLLIICVHIPLRYQSNIQYYREFYGLIEQFNEVHIMTGHTHYNQNYINHQTGVYEHIHGAACGSWWTSIINSDGTPNGYGVYEVEDNSIVNWYYKSTFFDKDYQIRYYPPFSFGDDSGEIIANVWNGDDDWKIELYENGTKTGNMERFTDYEKAVFQFFTSLGKTRPTPPTGTNTWFRRPNHLYKLKPKSNNSNFTIKATDRYGNVYFRNEPTTSIEEFIKYE